MDVPDGHRLVAGPLTLFLDDGGLRYIRLGEHEVVRRIYVAVRDESWATIPSTVSELELEERPDGFAARFLVDHRRGDIHFQWRGDLRGEHDGTVTFRMDGEARSDFRRNRIGICVLHPIDACAGKRCLVGQVEGRKVDGTFPRLISPDQPFFDIVRITHDVGDAKVEVQFEGEVFEMEDQRNWCDDSFKTYSTPLGLPKPVLVTAGTRVRQQVQVRVKPVKPVARARPSEDLAITLGERAVPLPALGLSLLPDAEEPGDRGTARLAALSPAHLRLELPAQGGEPVTLERASRLAEAVGASLGLAVPVSAQPEKELKALARLLGELPRPAFIDLVPAAGPVTPPGTVAAARKILGDRVAGVAIGAGSITHFTEVNRNRAAFEGTELVFFPNSPQVHMADELTIAENLSPLPWIAETARSFLGKRPLALSPVSLKPRSRPPYADPRQASLLAAGFTAGHLAAAAGAGFARVTYYETTGASGVMMAGGDVFPLFHVLADVAELGAGAEVLEAHSSDPLEVRVLVLRAAGRVRALVASLTASRRIVQLPAALAGGRVRRLDTAVLPDAMGDPEAFRSAEPREIAGETLSLSPHEVVRIDVLQAGADAG